MVTTASFSIFAYSMVVVLFALLTLLASLRWRRLRAPACRILAMFGVFAAMSVYVFLEVGPKADLRLEAKAQPEMVIQRWFETRPMEIGI